MITSRYFTHITGIIKAYLADSSFGLSAFAGASFSGFSADFFLLSF